MQIAEHPGAYRNSRFSLITFDSWKLIIEMSQIDGNRGDLPINPQGNANVDMGGANADQLIEYVHSFDPK